MKNFILNQLILPLENLILQHTKVLITIFAVLALFSFIIYLLTVFKPANEKIIVTLETKGISVIQNNKDITELKVMKKYTIVAFFTIWFIELFCSMVFLITTVCVVEVIAISSGFHRLSDFNHYISSLQNTINYTGFFFLIMLAFKKSGSNFIKFLGIIFFNKLFTFNSGRYLEFFKAILLKESELKNNSHTLFK